MQIILIIRNFNILSYKKIIKLKLMNWSTNKIKAISWKQIETIIIIASNEEKIKVIRN